MKYFYLALLLIVTHMNFAQDSRLFNNDWQLTQLSIGDKDYFNPKNTYGTHVLLVIENINSEPGFYTSVCDTTGGTLNFDNDDGSTFTITPGGTTLGGCSFFGDPNNMEGDYFNFLHRELTYSYEIIDDSGNLTLIITYQNGDEAIYSEPTGVERIEEGEWILQELNVNSEKKLNPVNSQGTPITAIFEPVNSVVVIYSSTICESLGGIFEYSSTNTTTPLFSVTNFGSTLGGCYYNPNVNLNDVQNVEAYLIDFFNNSQGFMYLLIQDDTTRILRIVDMLPGNNYAIYVKPILSNKKYSEKASFSISPNPVVDELSISSKEDLNNYKLEIFDLLGKLQLSKVISDTSKSVNVQSLSRGLYLLSLTDTLGNKSVKKFLK